MVEIPPSKRLFFDIGRQMIALAVAFGPDDPGRFGVAACSGIARETGRLDVGQQRFRR